MREKISGLVLTLLEKHTPSGIRKLQLQILLNATAAAFDQPGVNLMKDCGATDREALAAYAAYTKACLSGGTISRADKKRITQCACRLGRRIRRLTGFTRQEDLERLVFYLYSNIGIQMTGHLPGEITISSCYFSEVYTPDQCRLMSLMDRGVISGICGGGKLVFTERLTQGHGRCRACLRSVCRKRRARKKRQRSGRCRACLRPVCRKRRS